MLRSLNTAATGMDSQQRLIDTLSNNMANVNTIGFKGSKAYFHDLLYQNIRAPGLQTTTGTIAPSGIQIGNGSKLVSVEKSFDEGAIKITNKDTDMAIMGKGFFRIQLPDGNIAYTRDGTFRRSADGRIVTSEGLPLLPEIVVPSNTLHLRIAIDGVVTAKVSGEYEPRNLGQIQLANFINPAGLNSMGRNLYTATPASGEAIVSIPGENGVGTIDQGELETSNVNIVEEMVQLIVGQRAYELNSKVIKTGDEMLASTNQMK
ncbi:flagellar basal-body rod protein FlgG [Fluviispira multicolorata]|uniref:Flagellar basal-body rod protein FlgG n=1 Tax=Fluviispira multicolorata TaxID=2654512 RepID=A0A833JD23_9BACT|nr:flagellar basal-body rod protein FlgG [Fluviispira multicolorata]KAB8027972.1 flagellar basal-body rod protein FlgG [Fluviispira multicolorata]